MNIQEKLFSIFAIICAIAIIALLILVPASRQVSILIPLSLGGMLINVALMFIVLRDIFLRKFTTSGERFVWIFLVLFFWPTIIYYLPRHGFKKRDTE